MEPNLEFNHTKENEKNSFKGLFGKDTILINTTLSDLMVVLISFFGLLYTSQVSSIFTCQQVRIHKSNIIYQYLFAFGVFYFIILLVNKDVTIPPIQKFINCIIYFIIFLILNRLNYEIMILVLLLFFSIYFIFVTKKYYYKLNSSNDINSNSQLNKKEVSIIADHQYWITWDSPRIRLFPVEPYQYYYISLLNKCILFLLIILIILGFINYIGQLKYTFKNKITLYNIFIKLPSCAPLNNNLSFIDYILLAFNYKYYIKKIKPINS